MKRTLLLAAAIVGAVVVAAGSLRPSAAESAGEWVSLADSVQPLRDHFNQHREQPRFVALLSPT